MDGGKKCERIEWTIVLCRRCYPRGGSSPRATEENADFQSESNVTVGSLPRATEENADIQSESNVNNSGSASAVNAVVQAGTLEADIQSESNVNNSASASAVNAVVQAGTLEEPLPIPRSRGKCRGSLDVRHMLMKTYTSRTVISIVNMLQVLASRF